MTPTVTLECCVAGVVWAREEAPRGLQRQEGSGVRQGLHIAVQRALTGQGVFGDGLRREGCGYESV